MSITSARFTRGPGHDPNPFGLEAQGPCLPGAVAIPSAMEEHLRNSKAKVPQPIEGMILIDTGASKSLVDSQAFQRLRLSPVGYAQMATPGSGTPTRAALYPARFIFQNGLVLEFESVIAGNLQNQGIIALLGRDALRHHILIYHGPDGSFSLAF